jgi:L-alanine-DL-glutamate epimerase-like enolase superfamily enzyme
MQSTMKIAEITVTPVPSHYRKELGKNAYIDNIGTQRLEWVVRAKTDGGIEGVTIANRFMRAGKVEELLKILADGLVGKEVDALLEVSGTRVTGAAKSVAALFRDHPWLSILAFDLYGKAHGISAVQLLGGKVRDRIPAYDTTLYFQDLVVPEHGVSQVANEAAEAKSAGYRALKIKTGRGGRWMMPEAGMRRDVDVVLAVREAVGANFNIYVDANFGYDGHLNLLEDFMRETLPANIFWLEEMITHDVAGYRAMREMQAKLGSKALLVCGEVDRAPISNTFQDLIDEKLIDGYQPDIVSAGYLKWLEIDNALESTGVRSIPHNFGNGTFGTFAAIAFGAATETFVSLEDERNFPHIYGAFPEFKDGAYAVQERPGLGISIDEKLYRSKYAIHEWQAR